MMIKDPEYTMLSNVRFRNLYDDSTNWVTNNPKILSGELLFEADTGRIKIGSGKGYNSTPYTYCIDRWIRDYNSLPSANDQHIKPSTSSGKNVEDYLNIYNDIIYPITTTNAVKLEENGNSLKSWMTDIISSTVDTKLIKISNAECLDSISIISTIKANSTNIDIRIGTIGNTVICSPNIVTEINSNLRLGDENIIVAAKNVSIIGMTGLGDAKGITVTTEGVMPYNKSSSIGSSNNVFYNIYSERFYGETFYGKLQGNADTASGLNSSVKIGYADFNGAKNLKWTDMGMVPQYMVGGFTLLVENWDANTKTVTIQNNNALINKYFSPHVVFAESSIDAAYAAGIIVYTADDGKLMFKAMNKVPTVNLDIEMVVYTVFDSAALS